VSVFIGLAVVFGSIVVGYSMHHGEFAILIQASEFIIIAGAAFGAVVIGNPPATVKAMFAETLALLKPDPYAKETFGDLLQVLYDIFHRARRDGLVGIEDHVERPYESDLFKRYPSFRENPHAVSFLSDTMKVLLTGAVEDHHLAEILDLDLDQHHHEAMVVPNRLRTVADAMPGFGIVAAVLGVIITMGKIGGSPEAIGRSVAAALVGTFLGILLAYGVVGPIAQALQNRAASHERYLGCIRTALLSFARGDPPITCVEFARRNIEPSVRPSFEELEEMTRKRRSAAS